MKNYETKRPKTRLNCTFKITEANFFPVINIQFVIFKTVHPENLHFLSMTFIQKHRVSIFWYIWEFQYLWLHHWMLESCRKNLKDFGFCWPHTHTQKQTQSKSTIFDSDSDSNSTLFNHGGSTWVKFSWVSLSKTIYRVYIIENFLWSRCSALVFTGWIANIFFVN